MKEGRKKKGRKKKNVKIEKRKRIEEGRNRKEG